MLTRKFMSFAKYGRLYIKELSGVFRRAIGSIPSLQLSSWSPYRR